MIAASMTPDASPEARAAAQQREARGEQRIGGDVEDVGRRRARRRRQDVVVEVPQRVAEGEGELAAGEQEPRQRPRQAVQADTGDDPGRRRRGRRPGRSPAGRRPARTGTRRSGRRRRPRPIATRTRGRRAPLARREPRSGSGRSPHRANRPDRCRSEGRMDERQRPFVAAAAPSVATSIPIAPGGRRASQRRLDREALPPAHRQGVDAVGRAEHDARRRVAVRRRERNAEQRPPALVAERRDHAPDGRMADPALEQRVDDPRLGDVLEAVDVRVAGRARRADVARAAPTGRSSCPTRRRGRRPRRRGSGRGDGRAPFRKGASPERRGQGPQRVRRPARSRRGPVRLGDRAPARWSRTKSSSTDDEAHRRARGAGSARRRRRSRGGCRGSRRARRAPWAAGMIGSRSPQTISVGSSAAR